MDNSVEETDKVDRIKTKKARRHKKKRCFLKHQHQIDQQSFVLKSVPKKGRYLIRIQVVDLESESLNVSEEENIMICAQHVVEDHIDPIMDQLESIISNISKKLCGYSYTY